MATKNIKLDIIEKDLILQVELEESIQASALVSRLKLNQILDEDKKYFVKTRKGENINFNNTCTSFPENIVITENEKWRQPFEQSIEFEEYSKITEEIAFHNDTFWFFPLFEKYSWDKENTYSHLLEIKNIPAFGSKHLTIYTILQFSVIDKPSFNFENSNAFFEKIKNVMIDTLHIEFTILMMSISGFIKDLNSISLKMQDYANAHAEINWNTKIHSITILGFKQQDQIFH